MTLPSLRLSFPILLLFPALLLLSSCSQTTVVENPTRKDFPSVEGTSLSGERVQFPSALAGKPAVLLIGYKQKAQFDIDRWIYGLLDAEIPVPFYEVPTIAGMVPGLLQDVIDNGMRSGIPKPDWDLVVTVYEDADKIIQALGNENPNNAHVVLLNAQGKILWVHEEGYSARVMIELKKRVGELLEEKKP